MHLKIFDHLDVHYIQYLSITREKATETMKNIKNTIKRPEIYKPFRFLIVIFGLLELSGFAVLANYSIIMVQVKSF